MSFILRFSIAEADCDTVLKAFANDFPNSSIFRGSENIWHYQAFCDEAPNKGLIESLHSLAMLSCGNHSSALHYHIETLPDKNWLEENMKMIRPFTIDRFFIVPGGGQIKTQDFTHRPMIKISGSLAFGTGKHATTQLCIKILTMLAKKHAPQYRRYNPINHILDMGCGTNILGLTAAHLFKQSHITAIDIAKEAVIISKENSMINHMAHRFDIHQSDSPFMPYRRSYQLIIANILAEPLSQMRLPFAKILAPKGYLLLSGLLVKQQSFLHHAFQKKFKLLQQYQQNDWMAQLYQRKPS